MKKTILTLLAFCVTVMATSRDLKLLSDNIPDWTDIPSAAYSMTNSLASDEQKALAITKWVATMRHQVTPAKDSFSEATVPPNHPQYGIIYNPIKLANNYGNTFCVSTNSIPARIWKHLGKQAQEYDINAHTVCDLYWDGSWHNFDPAFGFFYKDTATGRILGCQEVVNNRNDMRKMMSDFTSVNRFDPTKQSNVSIYQGKTVYDILVRTNEYSGIDATRTTLYTEQYTDSYTYKLHIKPFERYARLGKQINKNEIKYFLPSSSSSTLNPNTSSGMELNIVTNGVWTFSPDLSSSLFLDAASLETNITQNGSSPKLRPSSTMDTASFIYRVDAANIISHAELSAKIVRADASSLFEIWFSADSTRWFRIFNSTETGTTTASVQFGRSSDITGQTGLPANIARTRVSYFLKVMMNAGGGSTAGCGLDSLKVTTYTIVNPRTLPTLTLGSNRIILKSAGASIDPLEVAYHWTEFERNGATSVTSSFRSHKKRVTAAGNDWLVNVGGLRNPTLDSIVLSWPGMDAVPEGYSDNIDVGAAFETAKYYYTFGKNIALGKTVSAIPDTTNVAALTDNNGGTGATAATWVTGKNPVIEIDLGKTCMTSGVRVLQTLVNSAVEYLDSCRTFTKKTANDSWVYQGTFYQRQAWEPITNYIMPNTFDQPAFYRLKNRNLLTSKFSHAFTSPDSARYLKLEFANNRSRMDLQEIEVYDAMTRTRVNNEVDHGFTLPDPSFTAPDNVIAVEKGSIASTIGSKALLTATPNPFNKTVRLNLLGIAGKADLTIYAPTGQIVSVMEINSGNEIRWTANSSMPAGVYIVKVKKGNVALAKKIVLSR